MPDKFAKIMRQGQVSTDHASNFVSMSLLIQSNELGQFKLKADCHGSRACFQ
jgi:hypothetical protein